MYKAVYASVKSREPIEFEEITYDEFNGFYFKTKNEPNWNKLIEGMIKAEQEDSESNKKNIKIENISASYILFYIYNNSIYAFTGGYGSVYIKKYIEMYFGLYLVPKLVEKSNPVVKRILENSITGNRASVQYANRDVTSFLTEENMGSIYKEMNIEIDGKLAKEIGITLEENEDTDKKITLGNKDSIVINRTLRIKELKKVIQRINAIEDRKDNFVLSYFIPVRKIGVKENDLTEELIRKHLIEKNYDSIAIVGDEYEKYYYNSSRFVVRTNDNSELLDQNYPISTRAVFNAIEKKWKVKYRKNKRYIKESYN